ncbi:MAG: heavy-metal-associated domain-containing protein [Taibaiella sp.]|nr:heavy-metal-associated domain-containing protein [Taibaiella sp.]
MNTLKFKTNINCAGCETKVTPALDNTVGASNWQVNTQTTDKILTIVSDKMGADDVIEVLQKAGFKAEQLNN